MNHFVWPRYFQIKSSMTHDSNHKGEELLHDYYNFTDYTLPCEFRNKATLSLTSNTKYEIIKKYIRPRNNKKYYAGLHVRQNQMLIGHVRKHEMAKI